MKKHLVTVGVVVAILAGLTVFNMNFEPTRLTAAQKEAQAEAQRQLDEVHEAQAQAAEESEAAEAAEAAPAVDAAPAGDALEDHADWPEDAPDAFRVRFATTKGEFVIEAHKEWAPRGVERFYELVRTGFYDGARFFRVVPGFVVQFGIAAEPELSAKWQGSDIPDDPVVKNNDAGYISFASAGPNTRTTQVFINLGGNRNLDGMGFAPFAQVVQGMDIVLALNDQYGESPTRAQGQMQALGNEFLDRQFPGLDEIVSARLEAVESDEDETEDEESEDEDAE